MRGIFEAGKPAGVICHGPWTLVEADVVRGRTLTSFPTLAIEEFAEGRHPTPVPDS